MTIVDTKEKPAVGAWISKMCRPELLFSSILAFASSFVDCPPIVVVVVVVVAFAEAKIWQKCFSSRDEAFRLNACSGEAMVTAPSHPPPYQISPHVLKLMEKKES